AGVDLLDDLEPFGDRVAPGPQLLLGLDQLRVPRRVLDRLLDGERQLLDPGTRAQEEPEDRGGPDDPADHRERSPAVHAHPAQAGQRGTRCRASAAALRAAGEQVDFDHFDLTVETLTPVAAPARPRA